MNQYPLNIISHNKIKISQISHTLGISSLTHPEHPCHAEGHELLPVVGVGVEHAHDEYDGEGGRVHHIQHVVHSHYAGFVILMHPESMLKVIDCDL